MVDFAVLNDERKRYDEFRATELGKLFSAYKNAVITLWKNDSNENISNKRLQEYDNADRAAEKALVAKLMELAGV